MKSVKNISEWIVILPIKVKSGLKRILNATSYSISGFKAAYQNEAAFRQIVLINLVLIPVSFFPWM